MNQVSFNNRATNRGANFGVVGAYHLVWDTSITNSFLSKSNISTTYARHDQQLFFAL